MISFIRSVLGGLFALILALLSAAHLSAQTIVEYSFNVDSNASTVDTNLTASAVALGAGIAGGAGLSGSSNSLFARASSTHSSNLLSIGHAIADNDYFSFTVDVDTGYQMDLSSFQFDLGYTRNGTFNNKEFKAYLLTSIDGFVDANDILGSQQITVGANTTTATYPNGTTTITLSSLSQYQGITSSTEFRIYIADTTGNSNYIQRLDNFTLNGAVTAVPEPGTFALLGGSLALGFVMLRRRARS